MPDAAPLPRDAGGAGPSSSYHEVLRVPLRWWALSTTFHSTVLLAFVVATPLWVALAGTGVMFGVTTLFFVQYGAARLVVDSRGFTAGRARIPVTLLADPQPLSAEETRRAVGPDADARAFLVLRPYIGGSVMVQVADTRDPVPYWLVSSRHPSVLAERLRTAIGP